VFISWSGETSRRVALHLRDWLPGVVPGLVPWMSESDIPAGSVWARELADRLAGIRFGLVCVTKQNVDSAWMLFESGALSNRLVDGLEKGLVCPYLIDVDREALPSPLSQFQPKRANRAGTWDVVRALSDALAVGAVPGDDLERRFLDGWPQLERVIKRAPARVAVAPRVYTRRSAATDDMIRDIRGSSKSLRMFAGVYVSTLLKHADLEDAVERAVSNAKGQRYRVVYCCLNPGAAGLDRTILEMWAVHESDRDPEALANRLSVGLDRFARRMRRVSGVDAERRCFTGIFPTHALVVIDDAIAYSADYDWFHERGDDALCVRVERDKSAEDFAKEANRLEEKFSVVFEGT
jgi:hypothetical protein